MRRHLRLVVVLSVLALSWVAVPSAATAQEREGFPAVTTSAQEQYNTSVSPVLAIGSRVRITSTAVQARPEGLVVALDESVVTLVTDGGGPVKIPVTSITALETSPGRKRNWLKGLAIGAAGGVGIGLIAPVDPYNCEPNSDNFCSRGEAVGGNSVALALLGAGIGALIKTDRWSAVAMSTTAGAQQAAGSADQPVKVSGPRVGVTFLSDGIVEKLRDEADIDVGSLVTQFGWQFEKRFSSSDNGLTPVTEWVLLLGGLERGIALPSLTWLVGLRAKNGAEFGVGPNLTPVGVALAVAAGVTLRSGSLNFPVNLAVVPSKSGVRVSVLAGFNMRR